jgi:uncharacterized repeat protein (TIGR01451 family)
MQHLITRTTWRLLAMATLLAVSGGVVWAGGTLPGTDITNQATVNYDDSAGNNLTEVSNIVTTTVIQGASVDVSPDNSATAPAGETLYYAHTITNFSNDTDLIDVTASSSEGWTLTLWEDVNGDGLFDGGDALLTDTDADTVPDTGVLAVDATYDILVQVDVPAGAVDGTVDITTVTGTSDFDVGVSDSATDTTTVAFPILTVTKSVAPLGDQVPGTPLTYTVVVDNAGTADALNTVLTDPEPANTTYVGSSITLGGVGKTDGVDGDEADFTAGVVTVNIGTLAAGTSVTVTFQVVID